MTHDDTAPTIEGSGFRPLSTTGNDTKKIEFDCIDCGEHIERELNALDRGDLTPSRCVSCVLDRMTE